MAMTMEEAVRKATAFASWRAMREDMEATGYTPTLRTKVRGLGGEARRAVRLVRAACLLNGFRYFDGWMHVPPVTCRLLREEERRAELQRTPTAAGGGGACKG